MSLQTEIEFTVCLKIHKVEISGGAQYKYNIVSMLNVLPEPTLQLKKEASCSTTQYAASESSDQFF